jgi:GDP-4-dehydro-6-deoxy-D-mannose reductase
VRILVTGATGFVGRWLIRELQANGHDALGSPPSSTLDITDAATVAALVRSTGPDAIAHLAGLSYGPDARRSPERAFAVNEGGTRSVMAAAGPGSTPVLIVSSSEVYGSPASEELPLSEAAPLRAEQPYGRSKLAQERVAFDAVAGGGPPVVVARPFNHAGPGQRPEFVIPALAGRVLAARQRGERRIVAGNVDVRRDFSDVRDVVRAYRLILEGLLTQGGSSRSTIDGGDRGPRIYNIASGRSVPIRDIAEAFATLAGIDIDIEIDPELVRASDPPEIRGDASAIAADLGWQPIVPFETTLRDVFDDALSRKASEGP